MKFFTSYVFIIFAFWLQSKGQPKIDKIKFDHLTINDGLSSNRILCIFRDSKDFLWIGTDEGLDKYDSYQIKKYRYDEKQPGTISNNIATCIYEDRKKNIWVGTINGLNLYDPAKDNFTIFKNIPNNKKSLNGNYINSITEDRKGNFWIVTDGNCLNKWDSENQNFIRYPYENVTEHLYPVPAKMVAEDSKGNLWLVSLARGISCFNPESGKFAKYDDPSIDFGKNCYKSIYIDNQDKIWITAIGNGFFSYDPDIDKFEEIESKGDFKGTNLHMIFDIIPEDNRYLLLAVDHGGINRFDKVLKTFEYISYDPTNEDGLNNDGIWCMYKDREGILWIGTSSGGINYYNPKKEKFKLFKHSNVNIKSLSYNVISCFFEDHEGLIWIGTDGGGINVYNPSNDDFKVFKHLPSDPYSISGNTIRNITEDKDHDIWIATWDGGLNRFDRKTGRFFRCVLGGESRNNIISNLILAQNDTMWLCAINEGLYLFDKSKKVVRLFKPDPGRPGAISSGQITLFFEDTEKNMWICTTNGLNRYDSKSNSFIVNKFPENNIWAFNRDIEGNLLVGSKSSGIYYCKPDGTIIKTYNTTNGLPGNSIQAIVSDDNGNFWISSSNGISRFDHKTHKFRNYSKEDGLQGDVFSQQAVLKTHNGEIYFGGLNGFNSFFPDSLKDNDFIPPVYITDFQIFNKSVHFAVPGAQFQTHISEAEEIKLNWDQSVFSFSFAAINYTYPAKNQYAYMMEGFEKDWNYTNASRRYVTYTNLDPGKYTFRVRASNNDGVWNKKGVSLSIIILPPWWKTLFFKAAFVAFLIGISLGFYFFRINTLKKQKIYLESLVTKRTKEVEEKNTLLMEQTQLLNKKNTLLEEHQQQIEKQAEELSIKSESLTKANELLIQKQEMVLLQAESLEETNQQLTISNNTKDKFFSIIAHDLRNPFNVVSGFSELLIRNYKKLPSEKIEKFLNLIFSSSKNGNMLLENLLLWSRSHTGSMIFQPTPLNLLKIIEEIYKYLEGDALKKNIGIQVQIAPELTIDADENMLKTIFRNLLSNAIKFTPEDGSIIVSSTIIPHFVEVCVSDSGVGIPEAKLPLLFNLETNNSTKGTSKESGTGLGLVLCKEFVEKHHGKIWFETKEGVGTKFKFTLPHS